MNLIIRQAALDGSFWALFYFGIAGDFTALGDALLFALWIVVIFLWLGALSFNGIDENTKRKISQKSRSAPEWLKSYGLISTWVESMALAAFGHYILAGLYLVGSIVMRGKVYSYIEEYKEQTNDQ